MPERAIEGPVAVLMSADNFRLFQQRERQLYEQSEAIALTTDAYDDPIELRKRISTMEDDEIMQLVNSADLEWRTAAAIAEDAIEIEKSNTAKLQAATAKLNARAEEIEIAKERLLRALSQPALP